MLPKLSMSFGIRSDDVLITDIPIRTKDSLGLYVDGVSIPGMVTMYEEHDARVEAGYTLREWYNLDGYSRAVEVAHYRVRHSIEYHKTLKQEQEANRQKPAK